jgi:hypothetical protein
MRIAVLVASSIIIVACSRTADRSAPSARVAAAIPEQGDAPIAAEAPIVDLPVAGYDAARVAVPVGARGKRPIMIAAHGLGDFPEPHCDLWKSIVADRAFVLCPRGYKGGGNGYTFGSSANLAAEIDAGVAAIRERWPDDADPGPILYTGFSLGANYGIDVITKNPSRYPRAILIEASPGRWSAASAKAYSEGGGQRILFACGQGWCNSDAKRTSDLLDDRVQTKTTHAKNPDGTDVGHTSHGLVGEDLKRELGWVTEGDPRWSTR